MRRKKYQPRDDETLYTRRVTPGGRTVYEPHSLVRDMCGYTPGHYLVWVRPGRQSIKWLQTKLTPARARVAAAMEEAHDAMLKAIAAKRDLAGTCRELDRATEEKGWKAFRKAVGTDKPLKFSGPSEWDVVDAAIQALKENAAA